MKFSKKQIDFFRNANADMNLAAGSVRSGKTVVVTTKWMHDLERFPPEFPALIAGMTRDTVMANVVIPIMLPFYGERLQVKIAENKLVLPNGRIVYIRGAADQEAQHKIAGTTLCSVMFDELSRLDEDFFSMAMSRLSLPGARAYATTNTDQPSHWLRSKYLDKLEDPSLYKDDEPALNWKVWNFGLADNPWLPDDYVLRLEAELKASGEAVYRRLFLGEWCQAEGAVYDMSKVVASPPAGAATEEFVIGCDWGTAHPTVFVLLERKSDGVVYVTRELVVNDRDERLPANEISDRFNSWYMKTGFSDTMPRLYIDPSAAGLRAALEADGWVPYSLTGTQNKGARNVLSGIHRVSRYFGTGKLRVDPSCKFLISQLNGYVWDSKAAEKGEDKPLKENDDACDALRYAAVGAWDLFGYDYDNLDSKES